MQLDELRAQIDRVDRELVALFCRRMALSAAVAAEKQAQGAPVRVAAREQAVLEHVAALADEPLGSYTRALYETILSLSRRYQHACMHDEEAD